MKISEVTDTIQHADCFELMAKLPSESFDAILTDPPYGVTGDHDDFLATGFIDTAFRLLKPNSALMMFVGQATIREFWNEAEKAGFRWLNTVVWHYKNTIKRERLRFAIQYDPILYFAKGDFRHRYDSVRVPYLHPERLKYPTNNDKMKGWMPNPAGALCGDVWELQALNASNHHEPQLGHKWQKPLEAFSRMTKATLGAGDIMLDPFCGSGTSCQAAKDHGVHYVGIEQDVDNVNLSRSRLDGSLNIVPQRKSQRGVKDIFA